MKIYRVYFALLCGVVSSCALAAQTVQPIRPVYLGVSDSVTTTLLFPSGIKKASWCSPYFVVQQTKEVNNLLEIKWTLPGRPPTNLSVVTGDGFFYSFLIHYDNRPAAINFSVSKDTVRNFLPGVQLKDPVNEQELNRIAETVERLPSFLLAGYHGDLLRVSLKALYTTETHQWIKLHFRNISAFPFAVHSAQVNIRDRHPLKTSIVYDQSVPVSWQAFPVMIEPSGNKILILAIPRQQLAKTKQIRLSLIDKQGIQINHVPIRFRQYRKSQFIN